MLCILYFMAIVVHEILGNRYAYHHYRVGKSIKTKYIGPVDNKGRIRDVKHGDSIERVPVGTTTESLKKIYLNAVRLKNQTKKGKTINNNKDVSRLGQEAQERSTMTDENERIMFVPTEKQEERWVFTEKEMPSDDEFKTTWAKKHGGKTKGWGIAKRDWAKTNLATSRDYQVGMWQGRVDAANKTEYHEERKTASYNYGYHIGYTEYDGFRRGIDKKTAEGFDNKYMRVN